MSCKTERSELTQQRREDDERGGREREREPVELEHGAREPRQGDLQRERGDDTADLRADVASVRAAENRLDNPGARNCEDARRSADQRQRDPRRDDMTRGRIRMSPARVRAPR